MAATTMHQWVAYINVLAGLAAEPVAPAKMPKRAFKEQGNKANFLKAAFSIQRDIPDAVWQRLLDQKIPLRVWQECSALASAQHPCKSYIASMAAHTVFHSARISGIEQDNSSPRSTRFLQDQAQMHEQLNQSGFLDHFPTILTDAALQLQAAAGIWPDSLPAAEQKQKALRQDMEREMPRTAEAYANFILEFVYNIGLPELPDNSMFAAKCVLPLEHFALASMQYLSTVLQDPQHRAGRAWRPPEQQQCMCSMILDIITVCDNRVSNAMQAMIQVQQRAAGLPRESTAAVVASSAEMAAAAQGVSPAARYLVQEATRSRHHMENMSYYLAALQLGRMVRQQPKPAAADVWLPFQLADQVPATVRHVLQQLGCSVEVGLWTATCFTLSDDFMENNFTCDCDAFANLSCFSQVFLLEATPAVLRQPQLHDMQQVLQVGMLVPSLLLQWVAEKPSTNSDYVLSGKHACRAAMALDDMYTRVLQDGPVQLYQHMAGKGRQHPPGHKVIVPLLPAVFDSSIQLLQKVLPELLHRWQSDVGLQAAAEPGYIPTAASSTASCPGSSGSGSVAGTKCCSGSLTNGPRDSEAMEAANSLAGFILHLASHPPGQLRATPSGRQHSSGGSSNASSSNATTAGPVPMGQLCALLDSLFRMQIVTEQARLDAGDSSSASRAFERHGQSLRDTLPSHVSCADPRYRVGVLVDSILERDNPGSKPYRQLCGLLTTMLKVSAWNCTHGIHANSGAAPTLDARHAEASCRAVWDATCAAIATRTAKVKASVCAGMASTSSCNGTHGRRSCKAQPAGPATTSTHAVSTGTSSHSSGGDGGDRSSTAQHASVSGMLPWLVLLGRCCLQWDHHLEATIEPPSTTFPPGGTVRLDAVVPKPNDMPGMVSLLNPFMDGVVWPVVLEGFNAKLARVLVEGVRVSTEWLEAGGNAVQLEALGYDVQQLRQRLVEADAACKVYREHAAAEAALAESTSNSTAEHVQTCKGLKQGLQAVGVALTSLVHPHACNNHACDNMSGPSEAKLVAGSSSKCGGCRTAKYCSKACQKAHWKHHKPLCTPLADAASKGGQGGKAATAAAKSGGG